jgi:2-polyprenyl-3-methyl-5-hydroxy-6-metoxy-1,4-benzoquinol methylase
VTLSLVREDTSNIFAGVEMGVFAISPYSKIIRSFPKVREKNGGRGLLKGTLERVDCNLCGCDDTKLVATRSRFDIPLDTVICKNCGLLYHNPRMTLEGFRQFYAHNYRELIGGDESPETLFARQVQHGYRILDFVGGTIMRESRVLDLGCGTGGQLWVFRKERECEVIGVEPAVEHVEWARSQKELDVRAEMIEDVLLNRESLEFVIISQTLNHLLNPLGILESVRDSLVTEGKMFLEVMDFAYAVRLVGLLTATTVDHPYMFAAETLHAMIQKAGFAILKWESDAEHPRRQDQPNMHLRVVAQKSLAPAIVTYPDYRIISERLRANKHAYDQANRLKWLGPKLDQGKGAMRGIVGDAVWNAMKRLVKRTNKIDLPDGK